jgi:hypothetical protein
VEGALAHLLPPLLVGRALDQGAVEALGEEDQMLAPLHQGDLAGEVGERAGEVVDVIPLGGAVGPRDGVGHRLHADLSGHVGGVRERIAGNRARPAAGGVLGPEDLLEHQAQGIDRTRDQVRQAQHLQGVVELPAVGGEAEHELRPARGAVGGDGHQVGGVEGPEQAGGGLPRPGDRPGLRERQVEEEQKVPPRGGGQARHAPGAGEPLEVERLEAGHRHPAAPLPHLEVGGREAAYRLAIAHHLHRHVDRQHARGAGERRSRGLLPVAG